MLPSVLSQQITTALEDFLTTGFDSSTPFFAGLLERFLAESGNLYKGPYLSVQLPFKQGSPSDQPFLQVPLKLTPYWHQQVAFERLRSDQGQSSIVATGTGSGKTECFLYPILDHCAKQAGKRGVKAILIYPMNALAADQAKRFAKAIHNNPNLKNRVTAGLFVGQGEHSPKRVMGPDFLITDKVTLREHPPDILLTNYKMLDLLLMRPRDQKLWRCNGPGDLRYLVVDELHTFDGAQGTDLACLIRRLKARLAVPRGALICVGTSATIGGDDARGDLMGYARQIFDEPFSDDAIIGETRQGVDEFLGDKLIAYALNVPEDIADIVDPTRYPSAEAYVRAQHRLLFGQDIQGAYADSPWREALGHRLKQHTLFVNLLRVLETQPQSLQDIVARFRGSLPVRSDAVILNIINALCALISKARLWAEENEAKRRELEAKGEPCPTLPFLQLRMQLWVRELRRMVAGVSHKAVTLAYADDLKGEEPHKHLPLVQCRECHATAWAAVKRAEQGEINADLRTFYNHFFGRNGDTHLFFPLTEETVIPGTKGYQALLCGACGQLHVSKNDLSNCASCGSDNLVSVFVPDLRKEIRGDGVNRTVMSRDCPACGARESMIVFGARATSLLSVAIGQSFATPFNDDRKLITFSDSVQDAAHRAGFFGARTWQNNVRSAIAQALDQVTASAFDRLPDRVIAWWSDPKTNPRAFDKLRFISEFIAPDKTWYQDYMALTETGRLPPGSRLFEDICKRLEWELLAEFGYRSQIGRTLERTRVTALGFDPAALTAAAEGAAGRLREEIGSLRAVSIEQVRRFIIGLLRHLKNQGAIYHRFLKSYLENGGDRWLLNRQTWLPSFGPRSAIPVFPSVRGSRGGMERLAAGPGQPKTWYQIWCEKVLGDLNLLAVSAYAKEIYETVLAELVRFGLLLAFEYRGDRLWGLNPALLYVTRDMTVLRCAQSRRQLVVPAGEAELWCGTPCIEKQVFSPYEADDAPITWFGKLYLTGDVHRVIAREHTGLLDRDTREPLEQAFIGGEHPWDPNLLSATPTLEMGIDIGDLSSVYLCSVPPTQANYLQRIGRAGRRDGNAFTLTIARGQPHDLYFYAEPDQMMRGRIESPGVFLNASAVLERQFTAFCLDHWVATGIEEGAIPAHIKAVVDHVEAAKLNAFPYTFLDFVKVEGAELLERFFGLFASNLTAASRKYLERFLHGDGERPGLELRIVARLREISKERESFKDQIDALKRRIDGLKQRAQDEATEAEMDELQRERSGLQALLRKINARETMNYFTDEGLIPNYAFPEAGVTLRSVIYRRRENVEDGEKRYENIVFEYERPGTAAIGELAPESDFYAGGRKVRIDQVDMRLSSVENWRFCPSCSYAKRVDTGDHYVTCPRCGDPMWSDAGQRKPMVRLRQVMANTPDHKSRIVDDRDDREPVFYTRQMLAHFEPLAISGGFSIANPELPFGFEFIAQATFREMNFGEFGGTQQTSVIAGVELPRKGFRICRHCGKVQRANAGSPVHTPICPSRDKDDDSQLIDCLYLYREFSSEAVRLLLPIAMFAGSDKKLASFVAAIQLGLKRKFGGKVDHLRVMSYEEPVAGSSARKHFLMLYDTVPGGTGYLKDLMRSGEELMAVFREALKVLTTCRCNHDPEKDGCYRCIYAYRNSHEMRSTSRDTAVALLSQIVEHGDALKPVKTLGEIKVNVLFDSELEARFIEALKRPQILGTILRHDIINGRPGYFLKVGERRYTIELQVDIGPSEGVAVASRPDFLIRSARAQDGFRPVAVFTDGFEYHRDKVGDDTRKRMALVRSGRFLQWSLSWHDVEAALAGTQDHTVDYFAAERTAPVDPDIAELQQRLWQALGAAGLDDLKKLSSLELLLRFLANPECNRWKAAAFIESLVWFDPKAMGEAATVERFSSSLASAVVSGLNDRFASLSKPTAVGGFGRWNGKPGWPVSAFSAIPLEGIETPDPDRLFVAIHLYDEPADTHSDEYRRHWNGVLRLYNLLQFLPEAVCTTDQGTKHGYYGDLALGCPPVQSAASESEPMPPADWAEVMAGADQEVQELLAALHERGLALPEVGFELTGPEGEVLGEAELAWESTELAVLLHYQASSRAAFEQRGWQVIFVGHDESLDIESALSLMEVRGI